MDNVDTSGETPSVRAFRRSGDEINRIAREEIAPAADLIEAAFVTAARSIEKELGRAARGGGASLKGLADALARDLGRLAIDSLVRKPIKDLLTGAFSAPFGGARANGGPVAPGRAFLVGERGPELFQPNSIGRIEPMRHGGGMVVNILLPGVRDAESFRRSETQIAASLARTVGRGQRNF